MPATRPASIPDELPIVPTEMLLLLHEPPVTELLKVVAAPAQTLAVPVIAAGDGVTVSIAVEKQPPNW